MNGMLKLSCTGAICFVFSWLFYIGLKEEHKKARKVCAYIWGAGIIVSIVGLIGLIWTQ